MPKFVRTEREAHLLIVTLSRPEVLNSLHAAACFELHDIWSDFAADPDLWVAIITGDGRAFCAGHDLADGPGDPMPESGWAGLSERPPILKPMIAAVNGHAYGGGFEIALACDIVVMDENAKLALSEPRVGVVALGGGAQRLVRKAPAAIAMGMLLTGRAIAAPDAYRWGIANEIAASGKTLEVARKWANDILACAPLAVQATKRFAIASLEGNLPERIKSDREDNVADILQWQDTQEGIAAFNAKRKPVWRGR